jgi:DNA repair protein SbcD/Mre11
MIKFIHAADIHLDSPMRGLSKYEYAPKDAMRGATRAALGNLVDLAIEEECVFILIAGDLFDGIQRDIGTAHFFSREMGRLKKKNIQVFIVYGNHDAETQLKTMMWPDNVRVLKHERAESIQLEEFDVVIHGRSFSKRDEQKNLAATYPDAVLGKINIGLLHSALDGHANHATYAPCSMDDLISKGYDYWALGHVHDFTVRNDDPYIVYSGNLQGRNVRETGAKGAVLVTVDNGEVTLDHRMLDAARWERREVDLTGVTAKGEMMNLAQAQFEDVVNIADGRPSAIRLTFRGKTHLHSDIQKNERAIDEEIRILASGLNAEIWVEKLQFKTEMTISLEEIKARDDTIGDLARRLVSASDDKELIELLKADADELLRKLPPAVKSNSSIWLKTIQKDDLTPLVREAGDYLVAQLVGEER